MKKHTQGFVTLIPLFVIAAVVMIGGGAYLYSNQKASVSSTQSDTAATNETAVNTSAKQQVTQKQSAPSTDNKKVTAEAEIKAEAEIITETPISPTRKIINISPAKASIGTTITIHGSGFSTTQNSIHYRKINDTKTRFIAFQASPDGKTLTFVLPHTEGVSPTGACANPCIQEPITPGTYLISVGQYFQVTAEESNYAFLVVE